MLTLSLTPRQRLHGICAALLDLIPRGWGARRTVAGVMLIMGFGRLGAYVAKSPSNWLTNEQYAWLLLILGVLVFIDGRWRMGLGGRICAGAGAILLATMAWAVGYIGVTSLMEAWFAVILLREAFTSHDC